MTSDVVKWGGLAGVLAGAMFVTSTIVILLAPQKRGTSNSFSDYCSRSSLSLPSSQL